MPFDDARQHSQLLDTCLARERFALVPHRSPLRGMASIVLQASCSAGYLAALKSCERDCG